MAVTNGYADLTHVQPLLSASSGVGDTFDATSIPTATQVESFLDQVAAEVDAVLKANGYTTVPATGTNDVLLIRRFVSQKAAALTFHAGWIGDDAKVEAWEQDYDTFISRLIDKSMRLIDQNPRSRIGTLNTKRYVED